MIEEAVNSATVATSRWPISARRAWPNEQPIGTGHAGLDQGQVTFL